MIADLMLAVREGDTLEIVILRDGEQITLEITADASDITEY